MTVKEYFRQAYRLDQRINSDLEEVAKLREMATSVGSPGFEEHYNPNRPTEAPFVHGLEKVWEMEQKIDQEIDRLIALKEQIRTVIDRVENADEQMVLRYRYIHNYTWERIGDELFADESTIRRWHGRALQHVTLPEDYIVI